MNDRNPAAREPKDTRLNIRISASMKAALKEAADKEGRSMANFVISILQEKLNREKERE